MKPLEELWAWLVEALEPATSWPGWPWLGAALALLLLGLWLGLWWGRRHRSQGAVELLTALERAALGDHEGAFALLRQRTEDPQAPPELYLALAALLRSLGHTERAAQIHRAILERHGVDAALKARASLGLASDFLTLGRASEAEAILRSLPRRVRRQEALLTLQRNAAVRSGDWRGALSAGNKLARRDEDELRALSDIYSRMAQKALSGEDLAQAAASFRRALSKDSDNVHACEGLARLYLGQGKKLRARRLLLKALRRAPDVAPRVLPLLRAAVGTPQKFDRELERLHREGVASPWVELEMAQSAYSREELEQARSLLAGLVERYPAWLEPREAYLDLLIATADERTIFAEVDRFTALALQSAPRFVCAACGHRQAESFSACPRCRETGTVRYEAPSR